MLKFHTLSNNKEDAQISILEIDDTSILFLKNFTYSSLLHYIPLAEKLIEPKIEIKKKVKTAQDNTKQNSYYTIINEQPFIKDHLKFDLQIVQNIDLVSINYALVSSIDDLILLIFLIKLKKIKPKNIYMTHPVFQIGFYIIQEFIKLVQNRNKYIYQEELNQNYFEESEFLDYFDEHFQIDISSWIEIMSITELNEIYSKFDYINYGQIIQLKQNICIEAISSGYSIGSCLWKININNQKILYCNNISSNSKRHPLVLQQEQLLNSNIDYFILGDCASKYKENYDQQIQKFYNCIINECQGLNIIIPIRDPTILLDLFDLFQLNFYQKSNIKQIFIISDSAQPTIQYGNSFVDYLNRLLQNKIYSSDKPENPFSSFYAMQQQNFVVLLKDYTQFLENSRSASISSYMQKVTPSIFFVIDSTLRFGPTAQMLEIFEETEKNTAQFTSTVILIDPLMQFPEVVKPYLGNFRIKVKYCPIEWSATTQELDLILKKIKPKQIIIPQIYSNLEISLVSSQLKVMTYSIDRDIQIQLLPQIHQILVQDQQLNKIFQNTSQFNLKKEAHTTIQISQALLENMQDNNGNLNLAKLDINQDKNSNKFKLLVVKNNQNYQDISQKIIGKMEQNEWKCVKKEIQSNGYKIIFENSVKQFALIQHTIDNTKIYGSSQDIIKLVRSIFDQFNICLREKINSL